MNYKPYKPLPPFKGMVLQNFPFIEEDFDAITNYQLLCKVVEYLKLVIDNEKIVEENVTYLYNAFIELKNYVDNYFDNLDVQEEINNKLDEMVSDGTLLNILSNYANIERIYNTFNEISSDNTLTINQKVKCFGMVNINDGYGGEFLINDSTGILLQNGLYAKPLNNYLDNYYNVITCEKIRKYDTDCYITTIPLNDENGKMINLYMADGVDKTPTKYARDNYTTLTINASLNIPRPELENVGKVPTIIGNGVVLHEYSDNTYLPDCYTYVCFTADRSIKTFKVNEITTEGLLAQGCLNVFDCFYPLLENGLFVDLSTMHPLTGDGVITENYPRQCLGIKNDKTIIILTCDGRSLANKGLTSEETQYILQEYGCVNAWNLDGGGSTSTTYKGSKINQNYDNNGTADRMIPYTLNAKKETISKDLSDIYSLIGETKQDIMKLLMPIYKSYNIENLDGKNVNYLIGKVHFGYGENILYGPRYDGFYNNGGKGYFINIPHNNPTYADLYNKQIFIYSDLNYYFQREMINGVWTKWEIINNEISNKLGIDLNDNTISADTTYQSVKFQETIVGYNTNNKISLDETKKKIIVNHHGFIKITANISIISAGEGQKQFRFAKNGEAEGSTLVRQYVPTGKTGTITVIGLIAVSPNTEIELSMYGNEGDSLYRGSVIIEDGN